MKLRLVPAILLLAAPLAAQLSLPAGDPSLAASADQWRRPVQASTRADADADRCLHPEAEAQALAYDQRTQLVYDRAGRDSGKSPSAVVEGLPIGDGRIGGLVMGGVERDRFAFNEDSLWTGSETEKGAYQAFGDLILEFDGQKNVRNYRRALDMKSGVASVSYEAEGQRFLRTYFASHPAEIIVINMSSLAADGGLTSAYTGRIRLIGAHGERSSAKDGRLSFSGALPNGETYAAELRLHADAHCRIQNEVDADGQGMLSFSGCGDIVLLLDAATNYKMDYAAHWRGENPQAIIASHLNRAELAMRTPVSAISSFDALLPKPVDRSVFEQYIHHDPQNLYGRVTLDLGASTDEQRAHPTDWRIAHAAEAGGDRELETALFNYGRYNLIASSRTALPANLQGLWNDSNTPPWDGDYHANINVEMNYWPAESTNLSETSLPFFRLVDSQLPAWRKATAAEHEFDVAGRPARGWAIRTCHNIYGMTDWHWDKTANAWYAQIYWEHYAFTGDKTFLKNEAYPILKEVTEFWEDHLKTLPDGAVVVPNGWSPEHGPWQDGVNYNQEILWELFDNYVRAADALGVDKPYRDRIAGMRDRLSGPRVGSWGQLLEYRNELHDPQFPEIDTPNDHHRHTSHLFGFFPGRQMSPTTTPELARAAGVTLNARGADGDSRREWVFAWRAALWARLGDGDKAHEQILNLFRYSMLPNMIGNHPPQQWDANYGVAAAIAEMLMQSQTGEIVLLPALPKAWPKGSVAGLRARGGFEIGVEWRDGKLTQATIKSVGGERAALRLGAQTLTLELKPGETRRIVAGDFERR